MRNDCLSSELHDSRESFDAGKHGKDYEIEISKFMFERLLQNNYDDFKFTREKKGLGKFDDLAIVYQTSDKVREYKLIQIKHVQKESQTICYDSLAVDKNSYFYLPKYFQHYIESIHNLKSDPDFKDASLVDLILCTNVSLSNNMNFVHAIRVKNDCLFKGNGKLFRFNMSTSTKRQIFKECLLSENKRLANELCSFIMLQKRIDMNNLIKDEHASLIKKYHIPLANYVIDVNKNKLKREFIHETEGENSTLKIFRHAFLRSLRDFCHELEALNIQKIKWKFKINERKSKELTGFVANFMNMERSDFLSNLVIQTRGKFGDAAVFPTYPRSFPSSEGDQTKIETLIEDFLSKFLLASEQKGIKDILKEELSPEIFIGFNERMNQWYHNGSYMGSSLISSGKREWITKRKMVEETMNISVNFQGRSIRLKQLVSDRSFIDSETLMDSFCCKEKYLGKAIKQMGNVDKCYINRSLTCKKQLKKLVLLDVNISSFLLTTSDDISKERVRKEFIPKNETLYELNDDIKDISRFIFAHEPFQDSCFENNFNKLKDKFQWETIHWLIIKGNNVFWKRTIGSFSTLRKYFLDLDENEESIDELEMKYINHEVVVVGEPGMGKSTLFDHFGNVLEEDNINAENPKWIIRLNSKDCIQYCPDHFEDLNDVVQFLSVCENAVDNFSKNFLKQCLFTNDVILMVDGFDELPPNIRENILDFLSLIKSKLKLKQIFISTRHHCQHMLENWLKVVSFAIKEISQEQQFLFLSTYWKYNSDQLPEFIIDFTKRIMKVLKENVTDYAAKMLGIPLQTYMFAVVFLPEVTKGNLSISLNSLPLNKLFRQFIQTKYEIYLKKSKISDLDDDIKQLLILSLDDAHQNFALCQGGILSSEEAAHFITEGRTLSENRLLDIGIVYKWNDTYQFVHKTYSEYLTAKRIADIVLKRGKNGNEILQILENLTAEPNKNFFIYLLDMELTEDYSLHRATLKGDENIVNKLTESEIHSKDCIGRSLAYYAVQYRHMKIIAHLFHQNCFSTTKDKFFLKSITGYVRESYNKTSDHTIDAYNQFFTYVCRYCPEYIADICEIFDVNKEIKRKNFILVEHLCNLFADLNKFADAVAYLEVALMSNAPLPIIYSLFNFIAKSPEPLIPFSMAYSNFINYLFTCETPFAMKNVIMKYKSSFQTKKRETSLFVSIYDYFNLTKVDFGKSMSSLLKCIQKRADNYTFIVKCLFESGSPYIILDDESANSDQLPDKTYNPQNISIPLNSFLETNWDPTVTNCSLIDLKTKVEDTSGLRCDKDATEVWLFIEPFVARLEIDLHQNVKEAFYIIVRFILDSTDARVIIQLTSKFHQGIKLNDHALISECLERARKRGWLLALLNSTNESLLIPEVYAKRKFKLFIFLLLSRYRSLH